MNIERIHYFRCPYCSKDGRHNQKVSKSVGLFRVKELYNNILILECQKCLGVCRVKKVGSTLKWEDLSAEEKKVFHNKMRKKYRSDK